jgi:hypothetical protein
VKAEPWKRFGRCGAVLGLALFLTAAAVQPQPVPAAVRLFEKDWVLMNWALKFFDNDRDILLSPGEAAAAVTAFRQLAETNRDGRVTTDEYRAARAWILARY